MIEVAALGLPIVLEVVDSEERIAGVLPKLEALMVGGIIMTERAHVIRYAESGRSSTSGPPSPQAS
jgi:PII-like signaling protein